MKTRFLLPLFLAAAPAAAAQDAPTPNSLTTYYASDFGYGGVMFDLLPATDLEVTAFDVNLSARNFVTVDVYYRVGSSFGFEADPNGWVLLESVQVNGQGTDNPSWVPLTVQAPTFQAGQAYGIYLELQGVTASNTLRYTNNPSTSYANAQLELTTNCAKAAGGITATTFSPREFNGTVYYNTLDGVKPALAALNFVAGQTATLEFRNGTPGAQALVAYSLTGAGPSLTRFGTVELSAPFRTLPLATLDANGAADFSAALPAGAAGRMIWAQGVDLGGSLLTNGLAITVQ
ncbi:MAG: hypothetical protein CMJ94_08875 [Planctomycetes bacterium]|nr:hypothetical protein [Planctomycetota bacterium]